MNLRARLAELQIAVMLLTRLPAGRIGGDAPAMAATVWAWPLVGALVGAIAGAVYYAAWLLGLPSLVAVLMAICALALATGAMHEDGLADLADGFGGGPDKERKLEIMRDSRIGTYGVLALVLSVALRVSLIAALPDPGIAIAGLVAMAMASRAGMALWLWALPPARDNGLGRSAGGVSALALAIALMLGQAGGLILGGVLWLPIGAAVLAGGGFIALLAKRQIGGQTGDVLGASQQSGEIAGLLALSVFVAT
ncbi:adenosylcobinamide-GDP ribazoletransferase [Primorskyibacter aestuariivivens]|uniref:adenosylcobinamide-GDP ribazoletransferase n=1 Tax=Primorskyibacter aestuariivivens TaxID=1888912 RepID=UPI00230015BB|nr:adenosylcobinamide-GDP ribazoletransferase [Primorskyibacter aestuariivivens]MDA7428001.1 adenosylcobinamide-GDP ribazoletransferase [Primorskyibacter aestuariivivens]